jgi:hypothetical protein
MRRRRHAIDDRQRCGAPSPEAPYHVEGETEPPSAALWMPPKRSRKLRPAGTAPDAAALEAPAADTALVLASLTSVSPASAATLAHLTGLPEERVAAALGSLVEAGGAHHVRAEEPRGEGLFAIGGLGDPLEAVPDEGPIGPFSGRPPEVSPAMQAQWERGEGNDPAAPAPAVEVPAEKPKRRRGKKGEAPAVLPGHLPPAAEKPDPAAAERSALAIVGASGEATCGEIADGLGIDQSAAITLVEELLARGVLREGRRETRQETSTSSRSSWEVTWYVIVGTPKARVLKQLRRANKPLTVEAIAAAAVLTVADAAAALEQYVKWGKVLIDEDAGERAYSLAERSEVEQTDTPPVLPDQTPPATVVDVPPPSKTPAPVVGGREQLSLFDLLDGPPAHAGESNNAAE